MPPLRWRHGCRTPRIPAPRRVSRRGGAARRGSDRRRRPFPGRRRGAKPERPVAARPAPPRQRGARGTAARRHHSRTSNQDERDDVSKLSDRIKDVIENEPVAIFMKGTPQFIMCGNSDRALRALREAGAPVTAVNILADPAIRQELQEVSGWPTIPQVFVKGELVGGADITQELAESGELTQILESRLGASYRDGAEEKVVDVLAVSAS